MIIDRIFYNKINKCHIESPIEGINYKRVDCKSLKKLLSEYSSLVQVYNIYSSGIVNEFLFDIARAISYCNLTDVQLKRLYLWFDGYNENEIAQTEGVSRWVVSKSITAACKKLLDYLRGEHKT